MALQEYRDSTDQTRYGYDSSTGQGIAFSNPTTYSQYGFSGFDPNAPVATFDTSSLKSAPDVLRPVISSSPARTATTNALTTLTQAEAGGTNTSLNRISDQINQLVQGIKTSGGTLSSAENELYNAINSLNGKSLSTLASANAASGSGDYRGLVSGVNQYQQIEQSRAKQLTDLLNRLTNRTSDIETLQKLFNQSPEEQSTTKRANELTSELRNFDVDTFKGHYALEDQNIPTPIIGRQQERLAQQRTFERMGITNELAAVVDLLNSQTATRQQKLQAAQFAFDANSQLLTDSINFYKMMAPENIYSNVDKQTGELTVVMRNPLTGETYKQNLGQVGTPEAWTDNIRYARENGVNKPFFTIDGITVINTNTGRAYSKPEQFFAEGGAADFSNVQHVNSANKNEKALVLDMAAKYVDAGIKPSDSLEVAQSKIQNSRIYRDQIRGPVGSGGVGALGLTNQQIDNISPLVSSFQNNDIVKNYNTIGETLNAVRSAGNTPTDDIQRVYAFAKIMDPASAVREGEYKTIQDYSTALLERYGLQARRVFDNRGFLTTEARSFLLNTLENRFKASETSYNNLYNETARRINLIGSTDKGTELLNNYGGAFIPTTTSSNTQTLRNIEESINQPADQGFWSKTFNWLFGN